MNRRYQEQDNQCNQDGFGETNDERTDPPLLLESTWTRNQTNVTSSNVSPISPRSIHRSSYRRTLPLLRRPRQCSFDSTTSSLSETDPDSPLVLDCKPATRIVSPVRTPSVTKSMATPICHNRQDGFSSERIIPGSPLTAAARSVSLSPTSTGRKAIRKSSPTKPNSEQDGLKLPPAQFSVLDNTSKTIEIMPGIHVPLRGAKETWNCVERDFFLPVTCFGCTAELCCIQDASYVLCPVCRVVGPMDVGAGDFGSTVGVGLGFSFDDLFRWQSDIVRQQQDRLVSDSVDLEDQLVLAKPNLLRSYVDGNSSK
jgi:hypothetical protein